MERSTEAMSQMLSFGFDTEILSLFWGLFGKPDVGIAGNNLIPLQPASSTSQFLPVFTEASPFLQLLVFPTKTDSSFSSYFQYSAITTGILAIVGISSYCTYIILTMTREKLATDGSVNSNCNNCDATVVTVSVSSSSIALSNRSQAISRPDSLTLSDAYVNRQLRKALDPGIVTRRIFSGEEPDDEEDEFDGDLEAEYFGPIDEFVENYEELQDEHFMFPLDPPISPTDSAYTSEYETLPRPTLRLHPSDNSNEI